jgi:hypothetical protein
MSKLEDKTKGFLDDVLGLFQNIAEHPEKFLDPEFAKDPNVVASLQAAVKEIEPAVEETKQLIDDLPVPLEKVDPVLPLKMAVWEKEVEKLRAMKKEE